MTAQQALQILDNAAASYAGTRGDHVKIQTAIAVLRDLVDKAEARSSRAKGKGRSKHTRKPNARKRRQRIRRR
jgi:hypothetical protein